MTAISQPRAQRCQVRTPIPGPRSTMIRDREAVHMAPGAQRYADLAGVVIDHAEGTTVTDVDGNTFLDFIGGIGVAAIGHSHPSWVDALRFQAGRASIGSLTSNPRVDLLERFAAHPPAPGVHRLQLYSGGAEAVESALRLARSYTGKSGFISCSGAFHGKTLGAMSLMGAGFAEPVGPMMPGVHQVPYADCYRCPLGASYPSCGLACVEVARTLARSVAGEGVAAVIVEPMQGTSGNVVPPPEYLPAMQSIAHEVDALLIADEMLTGLGRTGAWWGGDHSGVVPDIVTVGKAIGGGFPLSAVATTDTIARAMPWAAPSGSSSSYGGNPLAAAAGAAALRIIERENLVGNSRTVGAMMYAELEDWVERYPFVGLVRGSGMFIGMELVSDKQTKTPLAPAVTERLFRECARRGLLTMIYSARLRIQPPLTTDQETARNGLAILREVFDQALVRGWWKHPS